MGLQKLIISLVLGLTFWFTSSGYSVLTHEAIIDASWETAIVPLLKQKYPGSSEEDLKNAHAYAYGGCVFQDMGYYPLGSKLFTNLIHYVRSGDFVTTLLNDATSLNEYAFALGALCHYNADVYGHSIGINLSVPIVYPKMERKFGNTVTFADNRISHIRTEFAFDVLQTARGTYATKAYHDFIGFKISQPVLKKAFFETYGVEVDQIFPNFSRAVGLYRWTIINLFPLITKAAWANKKDEIISHTPNARSRNFIYRMRRRNYYHQFDPGEREPKLFARVVAFVIRLLPKVGPLRILKFRQPGPEAEELFIKSFDTTVMQYTSRLRILKLRGNISLNNLDFDTGKKTELGEYPLADAAYGDLLMKLQHDHFKNLSALLKKNILAYYDSHTSSHKILLALEELKNH